MTWTKLDDSFWMHPKVLTAGNTATGIYARMLSYCGFYLTDGLIPASVAQTIVGKDKTAFDALPKVDLVEVLETGSVIIPDYLEYNRSKADVEQDRKTRRENGRQGGRPASTDTPSKRSDSEREALMARMRR